MGTVTEQQIVATFQSERDRYSRNGMLSFLFLILFAGAGEVLYEHGAMTLAGAAGAGMMLVWIVWVALRYTGGNPLACPACGEDYWRRDGYIAFWWCPDPAVCRNCGARLK